MQRLGMISIGYPGWTLNPPLRIHTLYSYSTMTFFKMVKFIMQAGYKIESMVGCSFICFNIAY